MSLPTRRAVIPPGHPAYRYIPVRQTRGRANDYWVLEQKGCLGKFIGPYATRQEADGAIARLNAVNG